MSGPANYANPPRRDVVGVGGRQLFLRHLRWTHSIYTGSEVRIRFKADNPGPWFLHCHMSVSLIYSLLKQLNNTLLVVIGTWRQAWQLYSLKHPKLSAPGRSLK